MLLFLILVLIMVACEEAEDDGEGGVSGDADTSTYDTQGYIESGELRVGYMEGFSASVEGDVIHLATNKDSLGAEQPPADGVIVDVTAIPDSDVAADASVVDILDNYVADNNLDYEAGQADMLTPDTRAMAFLNSDEIDGQMVVRDYEGAYVVFMVKTGEGKINEFQSRLALIELNTSYGAEE